MSTRRKFPHERGPRPDRNEDKRIDAIERLREAKAWARDPDHRERLQRTIEKTQAKLSTADRP